MSCSFRVYYTIQGGHTHTRWFAGKGARETVSMACCGDLTFRNEEFDFLRNQLADQSCIIFHEEKEMKTEKKK